MCIIENVDMKRGMRQMNKQNQNKQKTLLSWIHKNRVKIGIWLFLIVLPISLLITAYIGSYTANKSVYFDKEINEESVKINDFVTKDELKALTLNIEWNSLKKPSLNDEGDLVGGFYGFNVSYTPDANYQLENVKITPVLKTDWKNLSSVGNQRYIAINMTSFVIDFNYELPTSPLLFVTIEEPNLYVKVEYSYESAGQTVTEIEYVKFPLSDLNPKTVIPE